MKHINLSIRSNIYLVYTRRETQIQTKLDQPSWKNGQTPDSRNTPSTTNLEEEETVDAPGNDGNASMTEQVKRPNSWRKMMMIYLVYNSIIWTKLIQLQNKLFSKFYNYSESAKNTLTFNTELSSI